MAQHSDSILELAKRGAIHRYQELKNELAQLVKAFPHLGSAVSPDMPSSKPARRRGKLSAAGRRAIAAAQRARWARIKGKKSLPDTGGEQKQKGMSSANRKAVSERMKKYWAARRRAKAK